MPEIITLILGGRTYECIVFLKDEVSVDGDEMVRRAERLNANLGMEDCLHVIAYQAGIPAELRGRITLVFPAWRHPARPGDVTCVAWKSRFKQWLTYWEGLDNIFHDDARLLRRVSDKPAK